MFKFVILFFHFMISLLVNGFHLNNLEDSSDSEFKINLPTPEDFSTYLRAIDKVFDYLIDDNNNIGDNMLLGLHFSRVNLRKAVLTDDLPEEISKKLIKTFKKSDKILKKLKRIEVQTRYAVSNAVSSLYNSSLEYMWVKGVPKFKVLPILKPEVGTLKRILRYYPDFKAFSKLVMEVQVLVPNPNTSDSCLISLSKNPVNTDSNKYVKCKLDEKCSLMLLEGDNLGYAVTHRFLLLLTAHNSRGCSIFSEEQDLAMMRRLCSISYEEAQYFANSLSSGFESNITILDLLTEQIALCGLVGDAKFLQRSWMELVLGYQSSKGCFHNVKLNNEGWDQFGLRRLKQNEFIEQTKITSCIEHVTSVAVTALSGAVRFIVEAYY